MKVVAGDSFFKSLKRCFGFGHRFREIRGWFRFHFRKEFFKLLKEVFKSYPYDGAYLLELEKAKMLEMAAYFERSQLVEGWERMVKELKLCAILIDIITEDDDIKLYHYNGDWHFEPRKDNPEYYEMVFSDDHEYVCDVKVNLRNIRRFVTDEKSIDYYMKFPHEFYKIKAQYLYHKIRAYKELNWWD